MSATDASMTLISNGPADGATPGSVTAVAFGTVVAMWTGAYLARMPWVDAPGAVVLALVLALLAAGGLLLGRLTGAGARGGAAYGFVLTLLNLLVLGGLVTPGPGRDAPSFFLWIPGTLLFGTAAGALCAALGGRGARPAAIDWTNVLAIVGLAAAFVLVFAGGLVTSHDAGLAVPDWPNTFGYSMFLYPLARMTGGIFYEHAHRLFGSLVGLTTIAIAWRVWRTRDALPRYALPLASIAVFFVILQGVLGGLRVTGSLTLSSAEQDLAPSLGLAMVHAVTGQIFFALLATIAVVTTPTWRKERGVEIAASGAARFASGIVVPLLALQLVLGAFVRHRGAGVMAHIGLAVIVALAALTAGTIFWGGVNRPRRLGQLGVGLAVLTGLQFVLGFGAFAARGGLVAERTFAWYEVGLTTAHQANGALLLALAVAVALWSFRAVPAPAAT